MEGGRGQKGGRGEGAFYLTIGALAEMAGVHPQTLRMYERKGLLRPFRRSGLRRYSPADVERLRAIQDLTEMGVNLAGVRLVLELREELARAREAVARLEKEVDALRGALEEEGERVRRELKKEIVPFRAAIAVWRPPGGDWGR